MQTGSRRSRMLCALLAAWACGGPLNSAAAAPSSQERDAAVASVRSAIAQHDPAKAVAAEQGFAQHHPEDLDFRHLEPFLYVMVGDHAGWDRARGDLLNTWVRIRDGAPAPTPPSFMIDMFKIGDDTIITDQCYERAGRFGVIYRFAVVGPDHRVSSFFTVESSDHDNQVARALGQPSPVFTLDHFVPGVHETVAALPGLPAYADIRQRVISYIAKPQPLSASRSATPALSNEDCEAGRHPAP